jgi:hypothetical protein
MQTWALRELKVAGVNVRPLADLGADFSDERAAYLDLLRALGEAQRIADRAGREPTDLWSHQVRSFLSWLGPQARAWLEVHGARPLNPPAKVTARAHLAAATSLVRPRLSLRQLALLGILSHDEWTIAHDDATEEDVLDREIDAMKKVFRRARARKRAR